MEVIEVKKDIDASPIWDGYIFQGEVAICKALEKINELARKGIDLTNEFRLTIEEEEDFSIIADTKQIFQVKAYTTHKYSAYAEAWTSMMKRYPENFSNNYLILHKGDLYYQSGEFEKDDIPQKELLKTNIICGKYTLQNIWDKICAQINDILTRNQLRNSQQDIEHKSYICSYKIRSLIRERHETKIVEPISLKTIVDWITKNTVVVTEEIAWFESQRRLMNTLAEISDGLDLSNVDEVRQYKVIERTLRHLDGLNPDEIKNLLQEGVFPHHKVTNDLFSFIGFITEENVRSIIAKAIRKINHEPVYAALQYNVDIAGKNTTYQLTTHNGNYEVDDHSDCKKLQEECENIMDSPRCKDIDYFITGHINIEKDVVKKRLISQCVAPLDNLEDRNSQFRKRSEFGFRKVDTAVQEINDGL